MIGNIANQKDRGFIETVASKFVKYYTATIDILIGRYKQDAYHLPMRVKEAVVIGLELAKGGAGR